MVDNLFDKFVDDLREKRVNVINTLEELKTAEIKCSATIIKLKETLNEEQKKLLLEIEEQALYAIYIQFKCLYRFGIHDGAELFRNVKNCSFDEYNFQKIDSSNRALDAYHEYKKLRGEGEDCNSETYELITFIFDKAYEVGLFNGKHDIRV